jgi:sarcosine oxidase subunit alpha
MSARMEARPGEWIDRRRPLHFRFEGRDYQGFAGDTITSALAAAEVPFLGRSFKYHRPRGILSFANHDSNTLFQVDGVPNVRGDVTRLEDGMQIRAVNTFGGLAGDKARILDRLGRWLPVGFYYKAFHSKRWFPRWERLFRQLTGLGEVRLWDDAEALRLLRCARDRRRPERPRRRARGGAERRARRPGR